MNVPMGPVAPDRRTPRLVRPLVVPALVGVIAFAVGLWLGHGTTSASGLPTPAPSSVPTPTTQPTNGPSDVARHFDPLALIASVPGGDTCHGDLAGEQALGSIPGPVDYWYSKAWMILCTTADPMFLGSAIQAFANATPYPQSIITTGPAGHAIGQIPYRQSVFAGLITVGAVTTPGGVELSVTLVERPAS